MAAGSPREFEDVGISKHPDVHHTANELLVAVAAQLTMRTR
jgi:hypothetical protein